MGGQYSVKETCDVIEFGIKVSDGIRKSREDKEWSWMDAAYFIPSLITLFPAVDKINVVPKELGEMDAEDQATVKAKVLELFPEAGEGWMAFAQKAVAAAFVNYELVMMYLEMKKKPEIKPAVEPVVEEPAVEPA